MSKKQNVFSSAFRFNNPLTTPETVLAILDANGTFTLREANAALDVYESWRDFVVSRKHVPTKGSEDEIIAQLESIIEGLHEPIGETPAAAPAPAAQEDVSKPVKEGKEMAAPATKKTAPVKKQPAAKKVVAKAPKKEKEPVVMKPCACGCATQVAKTFATGHDARVHGWMKKIADGRMKFSEIDTKDQAVAIKYIKAQGITQGVAAKG